MQNAEILAIFINFYLLFNQKGGLIKMKKVIKLIGCLMEVIGIIGIFCNSGDVIFTLIFLLMLIIPEGIKKAAALLQQKRAEQKKTEYIVLYSENQILSKK